MIRIVFSSLFILSQVFSIAQVSGTVVDSGSKKPIPFVNIGAVAENKGTSSSESGFFKMDISLDDTLVFSAVGYRLKKVSVEQMVDTVELVKQISQLREVVVRPKKSAEEITLGKFKANRIRNYWSTNQYTAMLARYFAFPAKRSDSLLLEEFIVYTKSVVDSARFNVRIYGVKEDGSPGEYLYNENIYAYAKSGDNRTGVDVSNLNIRFPENGLFIAVEVILTESNKYSLTTDDPFDKSTKPKQIETVQFAPLFGLVPEGINQWGWRYSRGKWIHEKKENESEPSPNRTPVAITLTVTD